MSSSSCGTTARSGESGATLMPNRKHRSALPTLRRSLERNA
jgi:hypothetical protein